MNLDELLERRKIAHEKAKVAWAECEQIDKRIATLEAVDNLEWFRAAASQALDGYSIKESFVWNRYTYGYGLYFQSSVPLPPDVKGIEVWVPLTLSRAAFYISKINPNALENSTHPWIYRIVPTSNPIELGQWFRINILKYKQPYPEIASFGLFCEGLCK